MSSIPDRPVSAKRRHSQVYVDIPLTDRNSSGHRRAEDDTKENSPLKPYRTNTEFDMAIVKSSKSSSHKRKHNDAEEDPHDQAPPKTKKAKVADQGKSSRKPKDRKLGKARKPEVADSRATPDDFPNGSFYCHQCGKKRDRSLALQCTIERESTKGRLTRCTTKYCKACLHNRYGEELDDLKSRNAKSSSPLSKRQREKHVTDESYFFECFKCQDICNCPSCQKSRGDEPLGNFALKVRKAEKAAATASDKTGSATKGKTKGSRGNHAPAEPSPAIGKARIQSAKLKAKALPKPKPMPKPVWTHVSTPMSLQDAESRIAIREFVLRFSSLLQVANGYLEELDELSSESLGSTEGWDEGDDESVEVYAWISELSAKAIILGLVDVLATHAESQNAHAEAAAAKGAAKAIRGSGANLNRVWAALLRLKEANPSLDFRSPLPPPSTTIFRHTRSGMQNGAESVHIGSSAQVVPVIEDLIELAIETTPIREAIESGFVQEKEHAREVREAISKENASWKARIATKDKASRQHHTQSLQDLEYCGHLIADHLTPRFAPLGRDNDGRIYYALRPGAGEFDAALHLVHGKEGKVKIGKRRGLWTEDDRRQLLKWSWFIAVWGQPPEDAKIAKPDDNEDEDETDHEDAWWGFWQPEEILKLAEWISRKSGIDDHPKVKSKSAFREDNSQTSLRIANGAVKTNGKANSIGRTTTASSSLTSLSSSRSGRELSPLSDLSSDDEADDVEMEDESNAQGPPNARELHGLVNGLRQYAGMLQWRAGRVARTSGESREGSATAS